DIYHIMAGKTLKLLKLTVAMLSLVGEQRFLRVWKSFEYPHQWSKLPNPISHVESFMMSDCIRLGMVMLFILNRSLDANSFKPTKLVKLQRRSGLQRNQVANAIINCWSIVAKCTRLVFKFLLSISDYKEFEKILKEEREVLTI
ncbi:14541_t:CDS:1, partial [Racocetra persica]